MAEAMDLAMPAGGGVLTLRSGTEGTLEQPTTLVGTVDDVTGAMSGTLSIAPLSFSFEITSPIRTTVYVDAAFREVTPGSVTGTVAKVAGGEGLGSVTLDATVQVDLHIEVGRPVILGGDCTASPITLRLASSAPYDPATGRVTVVQSDLSVPAVPIDSACSQIIADGVNDALAGGGHSLSLTLAGTLPVPRVGAEATVTTLAVTPAATSGEGDELALVATVAPGVGAVAGVPTGIVELFSGDASLGQVTLDGAGAATLATSTVPVGDHRLRAVYRGDATYAPSESAVVEHSVLARPTVDVAMASTALIGGLPRTATVTVASPRAMDGARLDLSLTRFAPRDGGAQPSAVLNPDRVVVEWYDGAAWQPVEMAAATAISVTGSIAPPGGLSFPAGAQTPVRLRVTVPDTGQPLATTACNNNVATCPGQVRLSTALVQVDGGGAVVEELARADHPFTLVEAVRRPTTMAVAGGAVLPHTVRPGYSVDVRAHIQGVLAVSQLGVGWPRGTIEVLLDGAPAQASAVLSALPGAQWGPQVTIDVPATPIAVWLPSDIDPGRHVITMRWSGDLLYAPSEMSTAITVVEPAGGDAFLCRTDGITAVTDNWGAMVTFDVEVPATAVAGAPVEVDVAAASMAMKRIGSATGAFSGWGEGITFPVGADDSSGTRVWGVGFGLGPDGSGGAVAMERRGATAMPASPNPADPANVDQVFTFHDPTASVIVSGAPGEVVPVVLDEIAFTYYTTAYTVAVRCVPVEGPVALGEVEIAGTTVSVDAEAPVRSGVDEVTVEARTFPVGAAGTVRFTSDQDGALGGPVTVVGGVASLATSALSPGTHELTASFDAADPAVPDTTSEPVTVEVRPRFDCPAFAQTGNAAVVRLVYLELLRRCPDQAGFDHWVARLDGGTSPEAFARSIARTREAVGVVVDDAYRTMLGRSAETEGRTFWVDRLQAGSGRYDHLLADLAASAEFGTKAGSTNAGFVTLVYGRLLNRAPDAAGQAFWVGRLDAGTSHRALVLSLANLDEPLGVLVQRSYDEILSRAPSSTERGDGIRSLRATGDRSGLYAQLIGRPEFSTRAQGFPNPEA